MKRLRIKFSKFLLKNKRKGNYFQANSNENECETHCFIIKHKTIEIERKVQYYSKDYQFSKKNMILVKRTKTHRVLLMWTGKKEKPDILQFMARLETIMGSELSDSNQ